MAVSRISDILIACTLLLNAVALISSKLPLPQGQGQDLPSGGMSPGPAKPSAPADGADAALLGQGQGGEPAGFRAALHRLALLVRGVRRASCFIAVWNVVFFVLILLVFGS
jgi:hypothetical protein